MTGERCNKCCRSSIMIEIPGQFRDSDADDLCGSVGIPLCNKCLGTGRYITDNEEFLRLQKEVAGIRLKSFEIQLGAKSNKRWRNEVADLNLRLKEIALRSLDMIEKPSRNCLALQIREGRW